MGNSMNSTMRTCKNGDLYLEQRVSCAHGQTPGGWNADGTLDKSKCIDSKNEWENTDIEDLRWQFNKFPSPGNLDWASHLEKVSKVKKKKNQHFFHVKARKIGQGKWEEYDDVEEYETRYGIKKEAIIQNIRQRI